MQEKNLQVSDAVTIHYRVNAVSGKPVLLMLHSLSDNSHAVDGIIAAGLGAQFRVIAPDLRGRGKSSRPETGYGLEDHCRDLIALLDSLGAGKVYLAGHSFGGFLALYFAAHFPNRTLGLCLIDTAAELNPLTPVLVQLLTDRLGKWYVSEESYLLKMRASPFLRYWDADMRRSFLADTQLLTDNTLIVNTRKAHIAQCAAAVQAVTKKEWRRWATRVAGPSMVIRATEPFIQGHYIVPERQALETAVLLRQGESVRVSGNHMTMLFGPGAHEIAASIIARFAGSRKPAGVPAGEKA